MLTSPRVIVLLASERHELVGRLAEIIGQMLPKKDLIDDLSCGKIIIEIGENHLKVVMEPHLVLGIIKYNRPKGPNPPDSGEV